MGLSLTFGIARFANVAHPDFMMLGAYTTFAFNVFAGVPFGWAALLGVAAALLVGVPVARLAYDKLPVTGTVQLLIISIGVSFILRHVVLFVFGSSLLQFAVPLQRPYVWGPVRLTVYQIVTLVVAAVLVLAVHLLLSRTKLGRILRAIADNPVLCEIAGADVDAGAPRDVGDRHRPGRHRRHPVRAQPRDPAEHGLGPRHSDLLRRHPRRHRQPLRRDGGRARDRPRRRVVDAVIPSAYKEMIAFVAMALCLMFRPRGLWSAA